MTMPRPARARRLAVAVCLALLAAAPRARGADIAVGEPWTWPAGEGGTAPVFPRLANRGAADRPVAASSPAARVAALHANGVLDAILGTRQPRRAA